VLGALGLVGGAGVVIGALQALELAVGGDAAPFTPPRASDFTLQGRVNETTVVVLGAGVAGLTAAYELEKAGYAVTILEARDRIGGRSWTVRGGTSVVDTRGNVQTATFADGRWFNPGPARIPPHHTTLAYCRELGVPVEVFVNSNPAAYVASRDVVRRRRDAEHDLDGYISELLLKSLTTDALEATMPIGERSALIEHVRAIGGVVDDGERDDLTTVLDLGLTDLLVTDRELDQAMPMFHPVGGMDAIPHALAAAVHGDIRTGVEVASVAQTSAGVRVRLVDGDELTADVGICTLPPTIASRLDSDWDQGVLTALGMPQPIAAGKLGLEYDRRWWETDDRSSSA
jgi:monoamine oxidase